MIVILFVVLFFSTNGEKKLKILVIERRVFFTVKWINNLFFLVLDNNAF